MTFRKKLIYMSAVALISTSVFAITPEEHKAAKAQISADYKAAKTHCSSLKSNAKDVCEKEAKGREKVAGAELDYRVEASERNRHKLATAKADASYEVAKEKCDDLSGNAKDVCVKDAKAAHVRDIEAAKVSEARHEKNVAPEVKAADVSDAKKEAAQKVREADYKAAVERCDSLAGAAKDTCVANAKRTYGM
ncbi:hypothetical protein N0K08_10825 [Acidovorax sp. Be4]|uniref:Cell envelope biogenesis protein TolA n=1 Tax=Acidovorax bellezanensis TaxID=2976702 RepID=A0ABT2PLM9_9BURK|nr:hypothetical protein [Acidovorax sp. Be4]MCT9811128.1 hypothetical protein [Acidovorax sp. Be4]